MLSALAMLKYFPAGNEAVLESLARMVGSMCENEEQVRWLVDRMTSGIYGEWPGPAEMRACFCSRFKPKDGINAYSQVYPDGLPPSSEEAKRRLEGPKILALPPGSVASADPGLDAALILLEKTNRLTCGEILGPTTAEEIATAPEWLRRLEGYEAWEVTEDECSILQSIAVTNPKKCMRPLK
jgi:hypothetical protein